MFMEGLKNGVRSACCLLVALSLFACSTSSLAQQTASPEGVSIEKLISEIQLGLAKAQKELAEEKMPPLISVSLGLIAEATTQVDGKVKLFVVSFGQKWEKSLTQEIEITLTPPKATQPLKIAKGPSVTDQLVSAIVSAGKAVQLARANTDVPLEMTSLKVALSFVVKKKKGGGAEFEILPVTIGLSGELANAATQKITILYKVETNGD